MRATTGESTAADDELTVENVRDSIKESLHARLEADNIGIEIANGTATR